MSNVLTSSKLIKSIKRKAFIPTDQDTFEEEDFLDMLNEELNYFGIPHLLSTHEEYLVVPVTVPLTEGIFEYDIPERAIGNKLRGLFYNDGMSNLTELSRIQLEDTPQYSSAYNNNNGYADTFLIMDNKVVLQNEIPQTAASLTLYIYMKPNRLVIDNAAAVISNIDYDNGIITVSNFPDTFSAATLFDFVQAKSPNKILNYDLTPTAVSSTTKSLTFSTDDVPSNLVVGDYICLEQETIVPQLPTELHAILAQRVAVSALESMGDEAGLKIAQGRLDKMEYAVLSLIDNRVESANEKVRNRHSSLNQAVIGNRGFSARKGKL